MRQHSPQPETREADAAGTRQEIRAHRHLQRTTTTDSLQIRARAELQTRAAGGDSRELVVEGYAAVFEQPSEVMSFWGIEWDERIARGAFTKVLASDPDVRFMGQHEGNALARTTNGTLELREDENGLWFRAELNPDVQEARDLYALIERGDIDQMSFGFFMAPPSSISCEKLGHDLCALEHDLITEITRLLEISAVTFPAYPQASVAPAGAIDDDKPAEDDDETDDEAGDRAATLAASREVPMGDESARDQHARHLIDSWSTRWSTCGRSVPSS